MCYLTKTNRQLGKKGIVLFTRFFKPSDIFRSIIYHPTLLATFPTQTRNHLRRWTAMSFDSGGCQAKAIAVQMSVPMSMSRTSCCVTDVSCADQKYV